MGFQRAIHTLVCQRANYFSGCQRLKSRFIKGQIIPWVVKGQVCLKVSCSLGCEKSSYSVNSKPIKFPAFAIYVCIIAIHVEKKMYI
jgi:hypothetical protein